MSGGFFRGTSADQDTRFSNKQAKLLKSQKFPAELEHLVDMTKVKMDVIRPWIANRVTQLLDFEDEVLINFIYGLLDGKDVDGKHIQIQLTGFMEKNTGKFMKELWGLLLSAQKNASGIPQQFLDAKEEELRKKKEETDRITNEIQKKREKEGRESELEKQKGGEAASDGIPNRLSTEYSIQDRDADDRRDFQREARGSRSPARPGSKSFSRSRSYSGDGRRRSRSLSESPVPLQHSVSPVRQYQSRRHSRSPKRSISPRRRRSPRRPQSPLPRRRSPYIRRRSLSPSRRRTPSPRRHRSPRPSRRRSPSPYRRRSPPVRRRSPAIRRKMPSPQWRSPTPPRRRAMSPLRRSPLRESPEYRRRSPAPRSPGHLRRSPMQSSWKHDSRRAPQSHSPERSPDSLHQRRRSMMSRELDNHSNGVSSPIQDDRVPRRPQVNEDGHSNSGLKDRESQMLSTSLRSPQRDLRTKSDDRHKGPVQASSTEKSQSSPESAQQKVLSTKPRRDMSSSPRRQPRRGSGGHGTPETSHKEVVNRPREKTSTKMDLHDRQRKPILIREEVEYGLGRVDNERSQQEAGEQVRLKRLASTEEYRVERNESTISGSDDYSDHDRKRKSGQKSSKGNVENYHVNTVGLNSDNDGGEKRKHDKTDSHADDNDGHDSQTYDRKEAKRRRKEEKKLRKEEKRQRREEKHRRREERRASKLRTKHVDTVTPPSDIEKSDSDAGLSYDKRTSTKKDHHGSDSEGTESEQRKLEIELRKKALESLRAKKVISH